MQGLVYILRPLVIVAFQNRVLATSMNVLSPKSGIFLVLCSADDGYSHLYVALLLKQLLMFTAYIANVSEQLQISLKPRSALFTLDCAYLQNFTLDFHGRHSRIVLYKKLSNMMKNCQINTHTVQIAIYLCTFTQFATRHFQQILSRQGKLRAEQDLPQHA